MPKKTKHRAPATARRTKRRASSATAAPPPTTPVTPIAPVAVGATDEEEAGRRRRPLAIWAIAGVAALLVTLGLLAAMVARDDVGRAVASPVSTIIVGQPGGAIIPESATPTASPAVTPTVSPTPTSEPTTAPTPKPVVAATVPPATAAPTLPPSATPAPTTVIVAMAQPDDSVAAFYGNVTAGNFDAAYSLWSDRMKATYPRQENLDERFDDTASITFDQLRVTDRTDLAATVQANFTETYDSGGSRDFVGYWRLMWVDGRWLLDEPHY